MVRLKRLNVVFFKAPGNLLLGFVVLFRYNKMVILAGSNWLINLRVQGNAWFCRISEWDMLLSEFLTYLSLIWHYRIVRVERS
jgi:hypothetical protein